MDNLHSYQPPLDDIESLIRGAGSYLQVSEDLRPRVLEAAHVQHNERQAARYVAHLAMVALLLVTLGASAFRIGTSPAGGSANRWDWLRSVESTAHAGDGNWSLVDSFTELRRRQADALRPASSRPPRGV